ncbi:MULTISPECIES: sensor histidine kinase [Streptomyces]|uniref:histidine kinase n=1 Tax=Streptomyces spinosisporus TaxID=2927582 RepID=A0ABS9XUA3_9ACTN|nr:MULTISPECIES: sensor histidine kinase [Streptomyces]MCI3245658.1 sensor domain-containing protein [Streptomyces spinosisporus]WUB34433.1 sensor domain-containing protein [Streptomyces sp. NBC_00588]
MRDTQTGAARLRGVLRAPFTRRAWCEAAYCLAGFPVALVGFVLVLVLLALGAGLTVSLVGAVLGLLFVVVATALGRAFAGVHRTLAVGLLGERVAAPPRLRPTGRMFARLDTRLRDAAGWRSVAYVLVKLPVAAVQWYALTWWVTGLVNLSAPLRWAAFGQRPHPGQEGMATITPIPAGGGAPHSTSFAGTFVAAAIGAATLLAAPWVTRGIVAVDRWLVRALLGPSELAQRVRNLEETRALAVDDSAALLRRLERDLHDGAQVRLVALAMSLDMAKERLGAEGEPVADPERLRRLIETAHTNATEALTELRDLSRGIHPPVLDDGLPDALATLAARSTVPVELAVDLPERPTPAIETIAYFCAAELLTNVIKHSGARRVVLRVDQEEGLLRLRVTDDGQGGATVGAGSGLTGLLQRVRTVDGTLDISSPQGGPTAVTVSLPPHA